MQVSCSLSDIFHLSCRDLFSYTKFIVAKADSDDVIGNTL